MAGLKEPKTAPFGDRPIVRDYTIVCLAALMLLWLLLAEEGLGWWSTAPLLIGAVGILANWTICPLIVLWCLLLLMLGTRQTRMYQESTFLLDVLLSILTLVYLTCAMRLLALRSHIVPPDARQAKRPPVKRIRGRWILPREKTARSTSRISSNEILVMLVAAPAFIVAAYLVYMRVAIDLAPWWFDFGEPIWRLLLLVWGSGIIMTTTTAFLAFLGRVQASQEESLLFLQDQLWKETRGEQRRINRWITWARLRRQEKEERT
jgi:hypothetical protein